MTETNIINQVQKDRLLAEMALFFAICFEPEIYQYYEIKEEERSCLKLENGPKKRNDVLETA